MKNTSETVKCEHTPTPWLVRNRTGRYHITPTDNEFLTCAATSGFNNQEAQANAQFIVTACNAYAVLLDACREAYAAMQAEKVLQASRGESVAMDIGTAMKALEISISLATTT